MSVISNDAWGCVLTYCSTGTLLTLREVNSWFAQEASLDRNWVAKMASQGLNGKEEVLEQAYKMLGLMQVLRMCYVTPVQVVNMNLLHHTALEWSDHYRCEWMLNAQKGTFSTAPGVTHATVTCKADEPFLLTAIHAKGGGRGFTSPLKKFSISAGSDFGTTTERVFELEDPSQVHTFVFEPPVLAHTVAINLLQGVQKDQNIDTDYIIVHGTPLGHLIN